MASGAAAAAAVPVSSSTSSRCSARPGSARSSSTVRPRPRLPAGPCPSRPGRLRQTSTWSSRGLNPTQVGSCGIVPCAAICCASCSSGRTERITVPSCASSLAPSWASAFARASGGSSFSISAIFAFRSGTGTLGGGTAAGGGVAARAGGGAESAALPATVRRVVSSRFSCDPASESTQRPLGEIAALGGISWPMAEPPAP